MCPAVHYSFVQVSDCMAKPKLKAFLFNLLVYPGIGQLVLNRPKRGWLLISIFTFALVLFFYEAVSKIMPLVEKVKTGKLALTQAAMAKEMQLNPIYLDWELITYLLLVLLISWLSGLIDCLITAENKSDTD